MDRTKSVRRALIHLNGEAFVVDEIVVRYTIEKGPNKGARRKVVMSGKKVTAIRPAKKDDKIESRAAASAVGLRIEPDGNEFPIIASDEDGPFLCYEINGQMFCW